MISSLMSWIITFICVVFGWVFFRAESVNGAQIMLDAMVRVGDISLPVSISHAQHWFSNEIFINGLYNSNFQAIMWIMTLLLFSTALPNTQQMMQKYRPALETYNGEIVNLKNKYLQWRPTLFWSLFIAIIALFSILNLSGDSEFLYFQF